MGWFYGHVQPGDQRKKHFVGVEERKDGYSGAGEAFRLESAAVSPEAGSHHCALPPKALTSAGVMVGSSACHSVAGLNETKIWCLKSCVCITLGVRKKRVVLVEQLEDCLFKRKWIFLC